MENNLNTEISTEVLSKTKGCTIIGIILKNVDILIFNEIEI